MTESLTAALKAVRLRYAGLIKVAEADHASRVNEVKGKAKDKLDADLQRLGKERANAVKTLRAARDATLDSMRRKAGQ